MDKGNLVFSYAILEGTRWMSRRIIRWLLAAAVLWIVFAAGVAAYGYVQLQPPTVGVGETVVVEIPAGFSSAQVAALLEEKGLIRNARVYRYYLAYHKVSNRLQAGKYRFVTGTPVEEITRDLVSGNVFRETVKVTIPEGYRVEQIVARLEEAGLGSRKRFLQLIQEHDFSQFPFVRDIPADAPIKVRLEGYLFPDTYEFEKESDEVAILSRMLERFAQELTPQRQERLRQLGLNVHQWVTLASLVEREAKVDAERPIIAGVIWNRIHENWLLQIDATVQYIFGQPKERLTYRDLEIDDPYNTYLYEGLPPGPIGAPGVRSLEAVLYPQDHHYFFYVTKKDGTDEHYFAETHAEHERNIALSRQNERRLARQP